MKPTFIWDLDGTLLDSYDVIVESLCILYKERFDIDLNKLEVRQEVIRYSVGHFLARMEKQTGVLFQELKDRYSCISGERKLNIKAMKHSIELLDYLKEQGIHSYVFTHRGTSTEPVLRNINMYDYFDEIVTSVQPFKRKPSPEAINYLVEKYHLDKEHTYYVGDRSLDMECAKSAGIKGIMYLPKDGYGLKTGKEDYIIEDLLEIKDIIHLL
ncbi:MAG: HAD-IA family hydrolase [Bacilli bacterium]|nr:HAD-IA family hydrolase [Bacilli bacterium]